MRRSTGGAGDRGPIFDYSVAEDVDRELEFHVAMRTRELIEAGWEPSEARAEALRLFGDMKEVGMECEEITRSHDRMKARAQFVDAVWRDLKFAGRTLRRSPLFAALAVLTLALGIGANTAIFSVVNGVLLQPLPYPEPERIVRVREVNEQGNAISQVAYLTLNDWREQARSFTALAGYAAGQTTVLGGERPLIAGAAAVTEDFFDVFGVQPARGRALAPDEFGPDPSQVAVVSDRFWRGNLGGVPLEDVRLEVYGLNLTIVGVMPAGFEYPRETDVWFPLELVEPGKTRTAHNDIVVGRLAEGVTLSQARDEMRALARRLSQQYPNHEHASASVVTLHEMTVAGARRPLLLLLGAAALVLLVACTNLASTLLARGEGRQRELAVRASIGAGRGRIVRQLFTESLLLAALGCVAGLALAVAVVDGLQGLAPATLPRIDEVGVDPLVLAFAVGISIVTAMLFGLLPGFRTSDGELSDALRAGERGSSGGRARMWNFLVASEVALALVLLAGSGLLIKSFWEVLGVDPGFDPSDVLTVELTLPGTRYEFGDPAVARFHREFLERIRALPGVERAGLINFLPLSGSDADGAFDIEGRPGERCYEILDRGSWCPTGNAHYRVVGGDYFEAMDIPLIRGRSFEERDRAGAQPVMLVNETMANQFWPGESPIGARVRTGGMDRYGTVWTTVIGVVGDVRHDGLTAGPQPEYYVHYLQRPDRAQYASVVIEASVQAGSLVQPVNELLRGLDRDVPAEFTVMRQMLSSSVADRRFTMMVLSAFAGLALLLAAVGIYGVVSYSVERRRREIGIRMALGARPESVLAMTLRRSMLVVGAGMVVGILGALALAKVLRNLLFEVRPTDPLTLVAVVGVLLAVALLACFVPARKGTQVDPMITMRAE